MAGTPKLGLMPREIEVAKKGTKSGDRMDEENWMWGLESMQKGLMKYLDSSSHIGLYPVVQDGRPLAHQSWV
jgi:hypothetical protein